MVFKHQSINGHFISLYHNKQFVAPSVKTLAQTDRLTEKRYRDRQTETNVHTDAGRQTYRDRQREGEGKRGLTSNLGVVESVCLCNSFSNTFCATVLLVEPPPNARTGVVIQSLYRSI